MAQMDRKATSVIMGPLTSAMRNWGKPRWALICWLLGLAIVIYYAPDDYQSLQLLEREKVVGFVPKTHDLVTVGYESAPTHLLFGQVLPKPVNGMLTLEGKAPRGDSIYVRDLDHRLLRRLEVEEPGCIYAVIPVNERLCVLFGPKVISTTDSEFRIAIVDASNGRSLHVLHQILPCPLQVCDDGKKLVYFGEEHGHTLVACVDFESGKVLYRNAAADGFVSPNGKYLAIISEASPMAGWVQTIKDLDSGRVMAQIQTKVTGQITAGLSTEWPFENIPMGRMVRVSGKWQRALLPITASSFSRAGDKFIDLEANVWDVSVNKLIFHGIGPAVFADGGTKLARIEKGPSTVNLKWRDLENDRELPDRTLSISEVMDVKIEACDPEGQLIHVYGRSYGERPTLLQKVLGWLGISQKSTYHTSHEWMLVDGDSGTLVHRGRDFLLAVSSDGHYAVTGDGRDTLVKVYELPVHRSILLMVIGCIGWSACVALAGWRRSQRNLDIPNRT